MSLYYTTATYFSSKQPGSLKSKIFNGIPPTKATAKQVFALASEASRWSPVLTEVIEKARLLEVERKVSPPSFLLGVER